MEELKRALQESQKQREASLEQWKKVKEQAAARRTKLEASRDFHKFLQDAADLERWLKDKTEVAQDECYANFQDLTRKLKAHEAFEVELGTGKRTFDALCARGDQMIESDHYATNQITEKIDDLEMLWKTLESASEHKRKMLEENLHQVQLLSKFTSSVRDLTTWIKDTSRLVSQMERGRDIPEADAILKQHLEYKAEIDAREKSVQETLSFGEELLANDHFASEEITEKRDALKQDSRGLHELWETRKTEFDQCKALHVFLRDAAQIEAWLATQEDFLENSDLGDSLDSVQALIKRHDDFEKSVAAHEEKTRALQARVDDAREGLHYDMDAFINTRDALMKRREDLLAASNVRKAILEDSLKLQSFLRDVDEADLFIKEKMVFAGDESYRDPTNLQGKLQKFQAFDAELAANKDRFNAIVSTGEGLIEGDHFGTELIRAHVENITADWEALRAMSQSKGQRLLEAVEQHKFNRGVDDFETWVATIESYLNHEDLGKDLGGVQSLIKKHMQVEGDVVSREEALLRLVDMANMFSEKGFFDHEGCRARKISIEARYEDLHSPLALRRAKLGASLELQQFLLEAQNHVLWIREKEPIARSNNYGASVSEVQILEVRKKAFDSELDAHAESVAATVAIGQRLVEENHFAKAVIQERRDTLSTTWAKLMEASAERSQNLAESMEYHRYIADAREVENFLQQKLPLMTNEDYGSSEDVAQDMIDQHKALFAEITSYKATTSALKEFSESLLAAHNLGSRGISEWQGRIDTQYAELIAAAMIREKMLLESLQLHELDREFSEVVEWLSKCKETSLTTDLGDSIETCEVLRKKFADFASDVKGGEERVTSVLELARQRRVEEHTSYNYIKEQEDKISQLWRELTELIKQRTTALANAAEIHAFNRDANETMEWIREKETEVSSDEYGDSVAKVQFLLRKHEVVSRDLAVVGSKLTDLFTEAGRLVSLQADKSQHITAKQTQIAAHWEELQRKAGARRGKLLLSLKFARFMADFKEISVWYDQIAEKLAHVEEPRDVPEAQARLAKHHEYRMAIDAQQRTVQMFFDAGEAMLAEDHYKRSEIENSMNSVVATQSATEQLWMEYHRICEEAIVVQMFYRDAAEAEAWIAAHEGFLSTHELGDTWDSIEALNKKHENIESSIQARQDRITLIDQAAESIRIQRESKTGLKPADVPMLRNRLSSLISADATHLKDAFVGRAKRKTITPSDTESLNSPLTGDSLRSGVFSFGHVRKESSDSIRLTSPRSQSPRPVSPTNPSSPNAKPTLQHVSPATSERFGFSPNSSVTSLPLGSPMKSSNPSILSFPATPKEGPSSPLPLTFVTAPSSEKITLPENTLSSNSTSPVKPQPSPTQPESQPAPSRPKSPQPPPLSDVLAMKYQPIVSEPTKSAEPSPSTKRRSMPVVPGGGGGKHSPATTQRKVTNPPLATSQHPGNHPHHILPKAPIAKPAVPAQDDEIDEEDMV